MNTGRLCLTPARDAFPMAQPAKCAIANLLVDVSFCRCYVVSLLLYVQMQRLASPVNICRKRPIGGVLLPAGSLFLPAGAKDRNRRTTVIRRNLIGARCLESKLERLTHCRLRLGFAFGLPPLCRTGHSHRFSWETRAPFLKT